jgi:hypothetical protein
MLAAYTGVDQDVRRLTFALVVQNLLVRGIVVNGYRRKEVNEAQPAISALIVPE